MKAKEFIDYWKKEYPQARPLGHELKYKYPDRWFRIHSLPISKRYADTIHEYKIILERQNRLISDLVGEGTEIVTVLALYSNDISSRNYEKLFDFSEFEKAPIIEFHETHSTDYDNEHFNFFVKMDHWNNDKNEILKAIADDEIRAMFVCPSKQCVIAPYDGGVDVIVDSIEKRNELKRKYQSWLSKRDDGL